MAAYSIIIFSHDINVTVNQIQKTTPSAKRLRTQSIHALQDICNEYKSQTQKMRFSLQRKNDLGSVPFSDINDSSILITK